MENANEPATKQEVNSAVNAAKDEIRAAIRGSGERLVGAMRNLQTEILRAFYALGDSNRQRVTQLEGNQTALITRIGILEDRMLKLERKVNFPGHPLQ